MGPQGLFFSSCSPDLLRYSEFHFGVVNKTQLLQECGAGKWVLCTIDLAGKNEPQTGGELGASVLVYSLPSEPDSWLPFSLFPSKINPPKFHSKEQYIYDLRIFKSPKPSEICWIYCFTEEHGVTCTKFQRRDVQKCQKSWFGTTRVHLIFNLSIKR